MANNSKFDKRLIVDRIISGLTLARDAAMSAAKQAHETATHSETVAKSKYETFGLEASYLAHGQAQRVAECEAELLAYRGLNLLSCANELTVGLSSLVTLEDESGAVKTYFIGPGAPGMKIDAKIDKTTEIDLDIACGSELKPELGSIMVITPSSPLGLSLMGKSLDDAVQLNIGDRLKVYDITGLE